MTANAWAMQFLADICEVEVARPAFQEVTALGAAKLAALGAGLITALDGGERRARRQMDPSMGAPERARLRAGWSAAMAGALAVARGEPPKVASTAATA